MSSKSDTFDVVIVGGGLAGLVAGVRAAELGLRPAVLEQGDGADYPCNSRQSGGILHIGFHDPFRPAGELGQLIARLTDGEAKPELGDALAGTGARLITWLQGNGARFMRFNQQEGYRWCMAPPRALKAGSDWRDRGPDQVLRRLVQKLEHFGGALMLRSRAMTLVIEGGVCVGIRGTSDGSNRVWRARHVILADGGFQSNRSLYQRNIGPNFDAVFQRGARTGIGTGLEMAVAAGARLTATNRFYGHLLCADARVNDRVWPYPELDAIATAGVVVDLTGRRIVDEGRTGVYLANALAVLPVASKFHAVFDSTIWEGPGRSARIPANPLLEQAGGTVLRADTIEDLANLMAVSAAQLRQTVDDYNGALIEGSLDGLAIPRSTRIAPQPIIKPPFMAIPLLPGITYTMGGIDINRYAEVLGADDKPIPGLLAAGATTGGLEGGTDAVYIGGLIKAGSFGLIAAERAAALQGKAVPLSNEAPDQAQAIPTNQNRLAAPPVPAADGLAPYPALRATLKHGRTAAVVAGLSATLLAAWLGWGALGPAALLPALIAGAVVAFAIVSYTELVRLITSLLIPDQH